ncbi:MAG TPA: hypothetical protein VGG85_17110 [Terracidiphilus sp.]|jgi:hypothetical protein
MAVQTLELKPVVSFAAVLHYIKSPLRIPAWFVVLVVLMAGAYGYVSGRQNPVHHYVPYVGYPLVLDTTTGKACYSSAPKPGDDASAINAAYPADTESTPGPSIPMCAR